MATKNTPTVRLAQYQKRWMADHSPFKIAVKSRQVGLTFATTLEIAQCCIERRERWRIVSRTQETAKEAMREVRNHLAVSHASVASEEERSTGLFFDGARIALFVITLPNGSEIQALSAHPDAGRGFPGNFFLDEFAFHRDSFELWKGAFPNTLRGHRIIVCSTPHYQTGKYYELARQADLVSGLPPAWLAKEPIRTEDIAAGVVAQSLRLANSAAGSFGPHDKRQNKPQSSRGASSALPRPSGSIWSGHWIDIHTAAPQLREIGVPIDLDGLRQAAGDDETWNQEFCCQFLSAAEMWIPLELIAAARSPQASLVWDPEYGTQSANHANSAQPSLYVGADIGRKRDRTQIWIDERIGDVAVCRGLITLDRAPFERQYETFCHLLSLLSESSALPVIRRACIDQTGIGMALVERLQEKFGSRVEGVTFTGERKENMALLVRRRLEQRLDKIPENAPEIERDLAAIKREATASGNLRFDAARTDAGHADIFWAKALANLAADSGVGAACYGIDELEAPEERSERGGNSASIWTGGERESLRPRPSLWSPEREDVGRGAFAG